MSDLDATSNLNALVRAFRAGRGHFRRAVGLCQTLVVSWGGSPKWEDIATTAGLWGGAMSILLHLAASTCTLTDDQKTELFDMLISGGVRLTEEEAVMCACWAAGVSHHRTDSDIIPFGYSFPCPTLVSRCMEYADATRKEFTVVTDTLLRRTHPCIPDSVIIEVVRIFIEAGMKPDWFNATIAITHRHTELCWRMICTDAIDPWGAPKHSRRQSMMELPGSDPVLLDSRPSRW